IDIAYGQREDIAKKPDPEVVFRIMQDAGVEEKADVIYAGDSDVDIYTGLNAGVDTVGVLWGFRDKAELVGAGAPILCETKEELYNVIVTR
ncbi:MAG: HAD family hydrolase, partial [Oscillospiraceae bacterium]|nr:HAD family hydrolase [Oscillospiraceae bacterium]